MPGFPVLHYLLELAQTHVHRIGDAIQPSHPLYAHSSSEELSDSDPDFKGGEHHTVAGSGELSSAILSRYKSAAAVMVGCLKIDKISTSFSFTLPWKRP